jgi:hypothetical protein
MMPHLILSEAQAILARTPQVLRAQLQGLPDPWLQDDDGDGTWSPGQVVAHLVEAEHDLWIPRMRSILGGEPFPPFDREGSVRRGLASAPLGHSCRRLADGWQHAQLVAVRPPHPRTVFGADGGRLAPGPDSHKPSV